MQLTVVFGEIVLPMEVGADMELENFFALVLLEIPDLSSMPKDNIIFVVNTSQIILTPGNLAKTLQAHNLKDQDILYLISTEMTMLNEIVAQSSSRAMSATSSNRLNNRVNFLGNPNLNELIGNLVSQIKVPEKKRSLTEAEIEEKRRAFTRKIYNRLRANPQGVRAFKLDLADVANAFEQKPDDYEYFHKVYVETNNKMQKQVALMHDETSVEGQKFIEEQLRIRTIQAQHEYAMEHTPEAFIPINLLHILVKINGVEVLAMIDSGAQSSIISCEIAKKCNLYSFIDERYFTKASGIGGLSKVIGRIHACKLQIGSEVVSAPIDVLDEPRVEILLGLNFLRPNATIIDLKRNILVVGQTEIPFLGDAEYRREVARLGQQGIGTSVQPWEDKTMETDRDC